MKKSLSVKADRYPYPSRYGSHANMVFFRAEKMVICCDELGLYLTDTNRLDNGLADPNRHNGRR